MIIELPYILAAWPAVIKAMLLASLQGAVCYGTCRRLEKTWPAWSWRVALLVLACSTAAVIMSPSLVAFRHSISVLSACLLAFALVGAIFHRRSQGASRSFFAALMLMGLTVMLSAACCFALLSLKILPWLNIFSWNQTHYLSFGKLYSVGELAYFCGTLVYPLLMPLGAFIWHNFRIRG